MEVNVIEIKHYHLKNILVKLDHTYNLKNSDMQKIPLTIAINFISSKDNDKKHVTYSKRDSKEIMINQKAYETIKRLFKSLLNRYQIGFKKLMKVSEVVFNYVHLLYILFIYVHCKCHK